MENNPEGISWVDNIRQKFEAICMEVDDMETLRYVENQLQSVGSEVKQFCTEVIQELFTSSPAYSSEGLNSHLVQNAAVAAYEVSNISANEDRSQTELVHSSSVTPVQDVHCGLSSEQIIEDEKSLVHSSDLTPHGAVIFSQALDNELQDYGFTAYDTPFWSVEEPIDISVSKMKHDLSSCDEMKLEESCIIVDGSELHSLSHEVGKRRSYKKKLRDVFSFMSRIAKQDDEQSALSGHTDKGESHDVEICESDWEII